MLKLPQGSRGARFHKGFRVKHVLQLILLLGFTVWLVYEIQRSHYRKDKVLQHPNERFKLGRKDVSMHENEDIQLDGGYGGRPEEGAEEKGDFGDGIDEKKDEISMKENDGREEEIVNKDNEGEKRNGSEDVEAKKENENEGFGVEEKKLDEDKEEIKENENEAEENKDKNTQSEVDSEEYVKEDGGQKEVDIKQYHGAKAETEDNQEKEAAAPDKVQENENTGSSEGQIQDEGVKNDKTTTAEDNKGNDSSKIEGNAPENASDNATTSDKGSDKELEENKPRSNEVTPDNANQKNAAGPDAQQSKFTEIQDGGEDKLANTTTFSDETFVSQNDTADSMASKEENSGLQEVVSKKHVKDGIGASIEPSSNANDSKKTQENGEVEAKNNQPEVKNEVVKEGDAQEEETDIKRDEEATAQNKAREKDVAEGSSEKNVKFEENAPENATETATTSNDSSNAEGNAPENAIETATTSNDSSNGEGNAPENATETARASNDSSNAEGNVPENATETATTSNTPSNGKGNAPENAIETATTSNKDSNEEAVENKTRRNESGNATQDNAIEGAAKSKSTRNQRFSDKTAAQESGEDKPANTTTFSDETFTSRDDTPDNIATKEETSNSQDVVSEKHDKVENATSTPEPSSAIDNPKTEDANRNEGQELESPPSPMHTAYSDTTGHQEANSGQTEANNHSMSRKKKHQRNQIRKRKKMSHKTQTRATTQRTEENGSDSRGHAEEALNSNENASVTKHKQVEEDVTKTTNKTNAENRSETILEAQHVKGQIDHSESPAITGTEGGDNKDVVA